MPKPKSGKAEVMWMIKDPDFGLILWTGRSTEEASILNFESESDGYHWAELYQAGCRCVKVKIEEVK